MKTKKLFYLKKKDRAAYAKYHAAHLLRVETKPTSHGDIGDPMSFEKWLDIYSSRASRRVW